MMIRLAVPPPSWSNKNLTSSASRPWDSTRESFGLRPGFFLLGLAGLAGLAALVAWHGGRGRLCERERGRLGRGPQGSAGAGEARLSLALSPPPPRVVSDNDRNGPS